MKYLVVLLLLFLVLVPVSAEMIGGSKGWIEIRCNVDGASVLFDGSYKGTISGGSLTVPVFTTAAPFSSVSVEKSGYSSYSGPLTMPAEGQTTVVYATLNPVPTPPTPEPVRYGSIFVESDPAGAEISFNGDFRGYSPITISDVWPGSYTIAAEKDGYRTYSATTTVSSGSRSHVYCTLTPIVTSGSLYILSDPSGANIYLDTAYKGRTPMTITNAAPGTHILEIDHSGYYDWKSTVDVPAGGTRTITATLNPMPVSSAGWVYVSSSPGGASVTLDGSPVGQTPYSGSLKLNNIGAGIHVVALSLTGYSSYTTQVSVAPNTVSEVSAILPSSAPVPVTGSISVSSEPSGAQVFLDNAFIGITPVTLNSVAVGSHTVSIRLDGYQEYTTTTPVNAGATNAVSAAMMPVTKSTPKSPIPAILSLMALGLAALGADRRLL